jgi:hypothetical protein
MSVGCFVGPIRSSYIDEAQESAQVFVDCINRTLTRNGLPNYKESECAPDVYHDDLFGRSTLDHHSASCLLKLAEVAMHNGHAPHFGLLALNPYRVAFLPIDFNEPLISGYWERIWDTEVEIWIGSVPRLFAELVVLAPVHGIRLVGRQLPDEIAQKINDFAALYDGDDCSLSEDHRTAWLLLYEGARLAAQHSVALSLAG